MLQELNSCEVNVYAVPGGNSDNYFLTLENLPIYIKLFKKSYDDPAKRSQVIKETSKEAKGIKESEQ